ncbi:MAG: ferrous iron transport protein B [Paludibacteraceae bacterium]|nr:ferrous iron transport protein B [Paludibacteraceae bacterium]
MDTQKKQMLSEMPTGSRCVILKVHGHGGFRHRILELGFVRGETVQVLRNAPLLDPVEYEVMGSHVSLRRSEAANIEVVSLEAGAHPDNLYHGTIEEHVAQEVEQKSHELTVALVGNPNCGKTSFFNYATGLHEKVGNYSGVTVDSKIGTFFHRGYTINLVDLPGTYSLTEFSPEELYVRSFLTEQHPDVVLNIVNAGNLERNLFLTTQLIDQNPRMVMALNMYDELEASGDKLDHESLSKMLGFPIVPVVAKTGAGIDNVLEAIVGVYEEKTTQTKHIHINYGEEVEAAIMQVKKLLQSSIQTNFPARYVALKLIEGDSVVRQMLNGLPNADEIYETASECRKRIEQTYHNDIVGIVSDLKYGFVRGALSETLVHSNTDKKKLGYALDTVLMNRWLGFPVLILFMWIMFQTTFTLGAYPQGWLESGVTWIGEQVARLIPEGIFRDLLVDGIITGVGGVLVFLPNILIMFLFISLLEDSGYMARAAFIMDRLMHRMGLHGKSFIPYLIGFGCNVPAVMATRTLENKKDRLLTMLTIPFMSCSARLPVYLLLVSAFFDHNKGLILLGIYLIGILIAVASAAILNKTLFKNETDQFVMELPPYRIPTLRNTLIHMWDKSAMYLKKMGTIILFASIVIWALCYFPHQKDTNDSATQIENSYMGQIGHAIEPVIKPLGFDWRMGVGLLSGMAAKEIIVSSLGILYENEEATSLSESLPAHFATLSSPQHSSLRAFSFMLFVLLYFPCTATLVAIWREVGWRWATFALVYTTAIAWIVSFAVWQIGSLF